MAGPVFWALDPFLENLELNKKAALLAAAFSEAAKAKIQTATVISPDQLGWPSQIQGDWEPRFREAIIRETQDFLRERETEFGNIKTRVSEPLILTQKERSLSRSVNALVKSATQKGASVIVASTHARRGMSRLAMGSFCESLASVSPIPVALVNPHTEISTNIRTLIFPSDFSDSSKARLPELIRLAKQFSARIQIFHKLLVPYPSLVEPGYLLAGTDLGAIETVFSSHRESQERIGQAWKEEITREGLDCLVQFSSSAGSILDSILEFAVRTPESLIVIPDQTGPLASVVLGHISRGLARDSLRPVLILPLDS